MHPPERTMMFKMPAVAQGRLVGMEGSVKGRVFQLSTGTFVIGRVETTDLPLSDPGVSREHAKIGFDGDAYVVSDLESRNGTFVNGKPVRTARLQEGDVVRICGVALRFTLLEVQAQPEIPPEFSLEDDTDEIGHAPRAPQARVATVSMIAPRAPPNPARRIVLLAAIAAGVVLTGAVAGIVIATRKEAPKVAVGPDKVPPVAVKVAPPVAAPVAPIAAPVAPIAAPVAPVAVVPAKGDDEKAEGEDEKAKGDEEKGDDEKAKAVDEKSKRSKPDRPKKSDASKSEWLAARSGPEPVFAPVEGIVTSIVSGSAVAGEELIVVNEISVKSPATGALRGAVRFGDRVRKGQLLARIQEERLRADFPSSLAGRAKRGAKVELQQANGSTKVATIVDVVAGTIFIDSQDDISWVRFR